MPTLPNANGNIKTVLAGNSIDFQYNVQADNDTAWLPFAPKANNSTAFTRSGDTGGTATMPDGHGLQSADVVDFCWTDTAGDTQYIYGATATVSGDEVTLAGGTGTAVYPPNSTVLTVGKEITVALTIDATALQHIAAGAAGNALLVLNGVSDHPFLLTAEDKISKSGLFWNTAINCTNPVTEDITSATVASFDTVGVDTDPEGNLGTYVTILALLDCTP